MRFEPIIKAILKKHIRLFALFFLSIGLCRHGEAQIFPRDSSTINYTQVLFEVQEVLGAALYRFDVVEAGGTFSNPVVSQIDSTQVTIIQGLTFGTSYSWKVTAYSVDNKVLLESKTYTFHIGRSNFIDSNKHRFRVIRDEDEGIGQGLIFLDYSGVAINREGQPVWYLPEMDGMNIGQDRIRDLQITKIGTITFNAMKLCREVSIDGKIIWETPSQVGLISGNDKEFYHHSFSRLKSGNYLALSITQRERELILGDQKIDKIPLSVIIEYNSKGDTVWTWYSESYVTDSDLLSVGKKVFGGNTFGHMNWTFENEKNGEVYASFRDLNAIVVIDRKSRKVIRSYGDKIPSDTTHQAVGFFKKQHAPVLLPKDQIIVFNNNEPRKNEASSVVIFSEAYQPKDTSKIVWEFSCDFDSTMPGFSSRMGNVEPLDSSHFLVNMGSVARLFEVTRDKKVIWDCLPESRVDDTSAWKPEPNYRLDYCSSLYPIYFSVRLQHDMGKQEYFISIVNEGTEPDEYTLQLIPDTNQRKSLITRTGMLFPGETFFYPIKNLDKRYFQNGFSVKVQSLENSSLVKQSSYNFAVR